VTVTQTDGENSYKGKSSYIDKGLFQVSYTVLTSGSYSVDVKVQSKLKEGEKNNKLKNGIDKRMCPFSFIYFISVLLPLFLNFSLSLALSLSLSLFYKR
jgi:hypothetical protein